MTCNVPTIISPPIIDIHIIITDKKYNINLFCKFLNFKISML